MISIPGFGDVDCSMTPAQMNSSDSSMYSMCSGLLISSQKQLPSSTLLDSISSSLLSSYNPYRVMRANTQTTCALVLDAISNLCNNGYLSGALSSTSQSIATVTSNFIVATKINSTLAVSTLIVASRCSENNMVIV